MKNNIAYKIVQFWHVIEFLSQEAFPTDTKENKKKVDFVRKEQEGRIREEDNKRISKFTLFYNYPLELEVAELIQRDNNFYKKYPQCSSAFHLCIGKIKREVLIKKLYESLNKNDDRPEEDNSEICLIAFKIDKDGVYEENSLTISPLVWGIYQCYISGGKLNGVLSSNYDNDIKLFSEKISKTEPLRKVDIKNLYLSVFEKYLKPILGNILEPNLEGSFIYTRYDSEKTFNREDDKTEDISDLVKGFYTDDLDMVKASINKYRNNDDSMYSDIVDYIIGAYNEKLVLDGKERIDIRSSNRDIERWLGADNAPCGRWPSKFNPALMQQIAINIGVSESNEVRKIFSVNGPPGTGKTTLLKDIIASNIVERAKIMCRYEKSDDAFEARFFTQGNSVNKGYDKYCNKYYAFKDKELSAFGMLVASCNNAAVENITKELPDGKSLIDALKPDKRSSIEIANGLEKVADLFDISRTTNKEAYKVFEKEGKRSPTFVERNDVYFSWLAHKLMSPSDETEEDIDDITSWGLISAPMGKASNISKYCYNVLNKIIESFYANNDMVKNRHNKYLNAKKEFSTQLATVEVLRKELTNVSRLSEEYRTKEKNNNELILNAQNEVIELVDKKERHLGIISNFERSRAEVIEEISVAETNKRNVVEVLNKDKYNLQKLIEETKDIQENIVKKEDSRKWYEILFERWMHTERIRQISELKTELSNMKKSITMAKQRTEESNKLHSEALEEKNKSENKLVEILNEINNTKAAVNNFECDIKAKNRLIGDTNNRILKDRKELEETLERHSLHMVVINNTFWKDFVSEDELTSTNIQISNPWVTEKYNREREKLFYLALQLHKEFILSSIACRDNFKNIAMMWKYRENSEKELCIYSQDDKKKSYSHLLNTLFLLTPVMSTTFASVGRFLGNIKERGTLGLLIVDEAGQAAPHVALGALWRCRKAIIVGDPKQVEPVVTDDADAIKQAFSDETLWPYKEKTISVQEFADRINSYGAFIKDTFNDDVSWVGCPLIVHRRCINPMFTISNTISYDGTMKMQTIKAKEEDEARFVMERSGWIDVGGREIGQKNHFVHEQGEVALKIISSSFKKYDGLPDLYVISPFTSVIKGIKDIVSQSVELQEYKEAVETWLDNYCGTVHKFQGKEAKEVIFLLGCDEKANGAVKWVKTNIVNVAATRAKYRLYIIGDFKVWKKSEIFNITKEKIDVS